jgi:hypothetical protein
VSMGYSRRVGTKFVNCAGTSGREMSSKKTCLASLQRETHANKARLPFT